MAIPSNGITADLIRGIMPPYHLSDDLLQGTFAALPPPPADASPAWRLAHIKRLTAEITALKPADAGQARMAAGILILRELVDTVIARAYAPDVTIEQMCRASRSSAELVRTAGVLVRTLERSQQKPVPFYGTVIEDEVDLAAVDRVWCGGTPASAGAGPVKREAAPAVAAAPASEAAPAVGVEPEPPGDQPGAAPLAVDVEPSPAVMPTPLSADTAVRARPGRSPEPAARPGRDAGATPEWTTTRLDQGPSWTLEVVRPRASGAADAGAAPGRSHDLVLQPNEP
jgi:hypothetical protein